MYVEGNKEDYTVCPVQALWTYFQVRKPSSGPLFTFMNWTPVSRKYFSDQLCLSLNWCGLDSKQYKGHSFRLVRLRLPLQKGYRSRKLKQWVDGHLMPLKSHSSSCSVGTSSTTMVTRASGQNSKLQYHLVECLLHFKGLRFWTCQCLFYEQPIMVTRAPN